MCNAEQWWAPSYSVYGIFCFLSICSRPSQSRKHQSKSKWKLPRRNYSDLNGTKLHWNIKIGIDCFGVIAVFLCVSPLLLSFSSYRSFRLLLRRHNKHERKQEIRRKLFIVSVYLCMHTRPKAKTREEREPKLEGCYCFFSFIKIKKKSMYSNRIFVLASRLRQISWVLWIQASERIFDSRTVLGSAEPREPRLADEIMCWSFTWALSENE